RLLARFLGAGTLARCLGALLRHLAIGHGVLLKRVPSIRSLVPGPSIVLALNEQRFSNTDGSLTARLCITCARLGRASRAQGAPCLRLLPRTRRRDPAPRGLKLRVHSCGDIGRGGV